MALDHSQIGRFLAEAGRQGLIRQDPRLQEMLPVFSNWRNASPEQKAVGEQLVAEYSAQGLNARQEVRRPTERNVRATGKDLKIYRRPQPSIDTEARATAEEAAEIERANAIANANERELRYLQPVQEVGLPDGRSVQYGVLAKNQDMAGIPPAQRVTALIEDTIERIESGNPRAIGTISREAAALTAEQLPETIKPVFDKYNAALNNPKEALILAAAEVKTPQASRVAANNRNVLRFLDSSGYEDITEPGQPSERLVKRALERTGLDAEQWSMPEERLPQDLQAKIRRAISDIELIDTEPAAVQLSEEATKDLAQATGRERKRGGGKSQESKGISPVISDLVGKGLVDTGSVVSQGIQARDSAIMPLVVVPLAQERRDGEMQATQYVRPGSPKKISKNDFDLSAAQARIALLDLMEELPPEIMQKYGLNEQLTPRDQITTGGRGNKVGVAIPEVFPTGGFNPIDDPGNRTYFADSDNAIGGRIASTKPVTVGQAIQQFRDRYSNPITSFPAESLEVMVDDRGKAYFAAPSPQGGQMAVYPILDEPLKEVIRSAGEGGEAMALRQILETPPSGSNFIRLNRDGQVVADARVKGQAKYSPELYEVLNDFVGEFINRDGIVRVDSPDGVVKDSAQGIRYALPINTPHTGPTKDRFGALQEALMIESGLYQPPGMIPGVSQPVKRAGLFDIVDVMAETAAIPESKPVKSQGLTPINVKNYIQQAYGNAERSPIVALNAAINEARKQFPGAADEKLYFTGQPNNRNQFESRVWEILDDFSSGKRQLPAVGEVLPAQARPGASTVPGLDAMMAGYRAMPANEARLLNQEPIQPTPLDGIDARLAARATQESMVQNSLLPDSAGQSGTGRYYSPDPVDDVIHYLRDKVPAADARPVHPSQAVPAERVSFDLAQRMQQAPPSPGQMEIDLNPGSGVEPALDRRVLQEAAKRRAQDIRAMRAQMRRV